MKQKIKFVLSLLITAYIMLSVFLTGVLFSKQYPEISEIVGNIKLATFDNTFTATQLLVAATLAMIFVAIPTVVILRRLHISRNIVMVEVMEK